MSTGGEEEKEKSGGLIRVRIIDIVLRGRLGDLGYRIAPGYIM